MSLNSKWVIVFPPVKNREKKRKFNLSSFWGWLWGSKCLASLAGVNKMMKGRDPSSSFLSLHWLGRTNWQQKACGCMQPVLPRTHKGLHKESQVKETAMLFGLRESSVSLGAGDRTQGPRSAVEKFYHWSVHTSVRKKFWGVLPEVCWWRMVSCEQWLGRTGACCVRAPTGRDLRKPAQAPQSLACLM